MKDSKDSSMILKIAKYMKILSVLIMITPIFIELSKLNIGISGDQKNDFLTRLFFLGFGTLAFSSVIEAIKTGSLPPGWYWILPIKKEKNPMFFKIAMALGIIIGIIFYIFMLFLFLKDC